MQAILKKVHNFIFNPYEQAIKDADEEFKFICWLYGRK